MIIRIAQERDLEAVEALYRILFEEMAALQPKNFVAAEQERTLLLAMMEDPNTDILVAEAGGAVLGFAAVQEQDTPPYRCFVPQRYAYLMDLAVSPAAREQGAGTALIRRKVKKETHV